MNNFLLVAPRRAAPLVALLLLLAATARAHDYWLEPENFFLTENSKVRVKMLLGDALVVEEERPYSEKRTVLFNLFARDNLFDLRRAAADNQMPAATLNVGQTGNYLLAIERTPALLTLEAAKFHDYLREEGLGHIIAERERLNESGEFGRERYSRFLKTLLQVGNRRDDTYRKTTGLKLEVVPLENPYSKKIGEQLRFKVLFDNAPLKGVTVSADNRSDKNQITTQKQTTDERGEVRFKLDDNGFWLIRLVTMRRCAKECDDVDWESFWAAFTFGLR